MYNGIGLETPRGTGTNGYVQRNLANILMGKERFGYKNEADIQRAEAILNRQPNKEILLHQQKRKVELKCVELRDLMEEQG